MAYLASGETMTEAWVAALDHLHAHGGEEFDLVVAMADPTPSSADPTIVRHVDGVLVAQGYDPVATVANTIFPVGLATSSPDRATLYRALHHGRSYFQGDVASRIM